MARPFANETPLALKAVKYSDRYKKTDSEAARKFGINRSSVCKMRKKLKCLALSAT